MVSAELLKKYDFFSGLTDAQLQKLASIATEESHDAGSQIYKIGDTAKKLYVVEEGKMVMVMDSYMGPSRPPLQVNVDFVTKGDAMGWSALVEPYEYTLGALCIEKSKLIAFDAHALRKTVHDDPVLGVKIMESIAKVIAGRLNHTRIVLVGERGLSALNEY
ncbi:MAG: Cyclic nucleotide-binding domain protein [Syntrophaceae bacterium PtaU1.Bin231]|nr:MAG: Cyclic nucleotide-binding domain protein [Syntrophaceae bacterium PtaU1.Bin231]HOG18493.1 cyclic nucleotide-binding domain-containing protein [Syntrophales bacterium]